MIKISSETYKIIQQTSLPKLAEKDMLECLILDRLFSDKYISENFVFSGGGSIAKSYNLTQRKCQDIDLACCNFPDIPDIRSQKQLNSFKRKFKDYVFNTIKPKICEIINKDQQFIIATDRDWKALSNTKKLQSSPTLHILYKSAFDLNIGRLCIEIIPRKYTDESISYRQVVPYSTGDKIGHIPTVSYEQTFWDKIYALYSNAIAAKPHCTHGFSRHYYDVAKMAQIIDLNTTHNMLNSTIKYQQRYTTKNILCPDCDGNLNLIPSECVLKQLEEDYENWSIDFLEAPEEWATIVSILKQLNIKLKEVQHE